MSQFRVLYSGAIRRQTASLLAQATAEGRLDQTAAAIRRIDTQLRTQPLTFGEFRYLLRHLRLSILDGAVAPVGVTYGVNEKSRFVVVRSFCLMDKAEPGASD